MRLLPPFKPILRLYGWRRLLNLGPKRKIPVDETEITKQVQAEMEAYFTETGLDKERQTALCFDESRFACSIIWLRDVGLQRVRILELGAPSLASRVFKRFFPDNELVNTDFDLRTRFPYGDSQFDFVLNMEVIEHIFDLEPLHRTTLSGVKHVLAECHRVLKPGGRMFLTTPNASSIWIIQRALLHQPPLLYDYHFREFTFAEVIGLVEAAGFRVERASTEKVWHFWNFAPIEEFMRKEGYSLENRGDDTFILARKAG